MAIKKYVTEKNRAGTKPVVRGIAGVFGITTEDVRRDLSAIRAHKKASLSDIFGDFFNSIMK